MYLFIDAAQRGQMSLKLFDETGIRFELEKNGGVKLTEELSSSIESFIESKKLQWKDLCGISLVTGPGSFTALRVGCLVVNIFGQLLKIPVYGATAEKLNTEIKVIASIKKMKVGKVILPEYGREPNITI